MKKLFKEVFIWSLPFLGLVFLLFFANIIRKDFLYGHFLHSTYKQPYDWFYEYTIVPFNKFYIKLKNNNREYLPQIRLYLSESKLNSFLSDLPNSTKVWQTGKIIHDYDNKSIKDIQIRLRGDNPGNWILEKQSFRIKLRKSEMHGRQRYYNYHPFEQRILTSNRLALNAKILAPKVRPIEFLINEEKKGLYLEVENFNENFLRRNKIMPVNFYKGENYNQETKIGLDTNLYNNVGLWSKEAYFNFYDKNYKEDLKKFLRILKQSKSSPKKFKTLLSYLDEDYFGRYLAYIILSQNYHISKYHNNRIVFDPWKGQIFPVITDPDNPENINLNFDYSSNDLTSILNQNSKFLHLKYYYLHKFLFEENILDKEINFLNQTKKDIINVLKKDPTQINLVSEILRDNKNYNIVDNSIKKLTNRKKVLISELSKNPDVYWGKNEKSFSIILKGQAPINNLELFFDKETPDWVYIDENYNNNFDSDEIKFFKNNGKINLDANFYANRINSSDFYNLDVDNILTSTTKFNLISSNGYSPARIKANNIFLKKPIFVKYKENVIGSNTNVLNKVIFEKKIIDQNSKTRLISGEISVKKDLVFKNPVKIKEGTIFLIDEGANIIFKNKVEAIGDKDNKIRFIAKSDKPWGTIALLGKNTAGSRLNYIEFKDGSGSFSDQLIFSSMLSIHNTSDIQLKNINFRNNHYFDDMVHIIYSSKVDLENLYFFNAFGDAIDIDISEKISIKNSYFYNSKNDGIDLMESDVVMRNVNIYNSQDKGISIGEASIAKIFDSKLEKNITAIAVKDGSETFMSNIKFLNNYKQISAYKKNLQYGSGGKAVVSKSIFENDINNFLSDKSYIKIEESKIIGNINKTGKNIYINERK